MHTEPQRRPSSLQAARGDGQRHAVPRRTSHRVNVWIGGAAFAIVFAGFARTYYLKFLFDSPPLSTLLHLHGALMTSWFALFFAQTYLIASRRPELHRRLGVAGAALAGSIVVVGVTVAIRAAQRDVHRDAVSGPPPLVFLGFSIAVLLVFAALVLAGLLLRRHGGYHKRLMLLACLSLVGPGLSRLPLDQGLPALAFLKTGGPGGLFGLDLLLVYAYLGWDTWRHRRLHPAILCGALLIGSEDLPFLWRVLSTPMWTNVAARLVR